MTMSTMDRTAMINQLARQVTLRDGAPYPELETALGVLVDSLSAGKTPSDAVDWPAVVGEALNLRPQH